MAGFDLKEIERRMRGALTVLKQEFGGLRTGRANMSLLDPIMVNAYGSQMPLNQLATVNVPESRLITVQVWDRSQVSAVERAIRESDLGLNPVVEGQLLRLPIPELNEERRHEIAKVAHKYTEQARIAGVEAALLADRWPDAAVEAQDGEQDGALGRAAGLDLPDPADRHVVETALAAAAPLIVTLNLRDFPRPAMAAAPP